MKLKNVIDVLTRPKTALAILASRGLLNWLNDATYLKLSFRIKSGSKLNLKNPVTFNEKIQWLKLYDRKPIYSDLVDKFEVRKYVSELLGEEYLVPLVGGPWNSFSDINFDELPDRFVLKCTHDSGGLYICRDKKQVDIPKAQSKISKSLRRNYYWLGREWPYKHVKPRIIAETYMSEADTRSGLTDYKFFCFGGEAKMVYVSYGLDNHETARISFFDLDGNRMPFYRRDYKPINEEIEFPANFDKMICIANTLAKKVNNPFVRIDLYSIKGKIYFSEITFSPCGGLLPFEPVEWDYRLGQLIDIPVNNHTDLL